MGGVLDCTLEWKSPICGQDRSKTEGRYLCPSCIRPRALLPIVADRSLRSIPSVASSLSPPRSSLLLSCCRKSHFCPPSLLARRCRQDDPFPDFALSAPALLVPRAALPPANGGRRRPRGPGRVPLRGEKMYGNFKTEKDWKLRRWPLLRATLMC